ncbi:MAG: hypothetical protein AAF616_02755 [Bacteroidota bacterium]
MFVLKKDRNVRNVITMLILFIAAFAIDATTSTQSEDVQEARFLGIGTKKEVGPCVLGAQVTTKTFTIFWIKVGDSWTEVDAC